MKLGHEVFEEDSRDVKASHEVLLLYFKHAAIEFIQFIFGIFHDYNLC